MKKCLAVAGLVTAVAAVAVPLILTAPGKAKKDKKAPFMGRNFAHRGLHSEDKTVPENSLEAFRQARDAGYGMELDVQLSKDGEVVVFHDDTLERICGVKRSSSLPERQSGVRSSRRVPQILSSLCGSFHSPR